MIPLSHPFRLATPDDADVLARFVNWAGEGMPEYLRTQMAEEGQEPWDVGRARQAAKAAEGQIVVVDHGQGALAGLTGYVIGPDPEPTDTLPDLFVPLQELENLAPNSWYVNVLAALPEYRGQGLGGQLLALAEEIGRAAGQQRMSIIVDAENTGARRLYERTGYVETARRPAAAQGWDKAPGEWVLLIKDLAS
ncbi:MAG: N-acetyltransferase [Pseudomonadota bacterium]